MGFVYNGTYVNGADVVCPAVSELKECRAGDLANFGLRDRAWATRFGITLASSATMLRGRGWGGLGGWISPRWKRHPAVLSLEVTLRVCSQAYLSSRGGAPGPVLVCDVLDLGEVREYVGACIDLLPRTDLSKPDLMDVLGRRFDVLDPDDG